MENVGQCMYDFNRGEEGKHDVILKIEGQEFFVMKHHVSTYSPVLFDKLCRKGLDKNSVVELDGVSAEPFQIFLELINGWNRLNDTNIEKVVEAVAYLKARLPLRLCEEYLLEKSNLGEKMKFHLADKGGLKTLMKQIIDGIQNKDDLDRVLPQNILDMKQDTQVLVFQKARALLRAVVDRDAAWDRELEKHIEIVKSVAQAQPELGFMWGDIHQRLLRIQLFRAGSAHLDAQTRALGQLQAETIIGELKRMLVQYHFCFENANREAAEQNQQLQAHQQVQLMQQAQLAHHQNEQQQQLQALAQQQLQALAQPQAPVYEGEFAAIIALQNQLNAQFPPQAQRQLQELFHEQERQNQQRRGQLNAQLPAPVPNAELQGIWLVQEQQLAHLRALQNALLNA